MVALDCCYILEKASLKKSFVESLWRVRFPYFSLISIDQILNLIVITILYCNFINSQTIISNENQNQNQINSTLDLIYILKYHSCKHPNIIFARKN